MNLSKNLSETFVNRLPNHWLLKIEINEYTINTPINPLMPCFSMSFINPSNKVSFIQYIFYFIY